MKQNIIGLANPAIIQDADNQNSIDVGLYEYGGY